MEKKVSKNTANNKVAKSTNKQASKTALKEKQVSKPVKNSTTIGSDKVVKNAQISKPLKSKLSLAQKLEYHERVSGFALYTNATISHKLEGVTYLKINLAVKHGKVKEMLEAIVTFTEDIINNPITGVCYEEKGKDMFRIACDSLRSEIGYKSVEFTTAYGDKYSFKNGETTMYNAQEKKWEKV